MYCRDQTRQAPQRRKRWRDRFKLRWIEWHLWPRLLDAAAHGEAICVEDGSRRLNKNLRDLSAITHAGGDVASALAQNCVASSSLRSTLTRSIASAEHKTARKNITVWHAPCDSRSAILASSARATGPAA